MPVLIHPKRIEGSCIKRGMKMKRSLGMPRRPPGEDVLRNIRRIARRIGRGM